MSLSTQLSESQQNVLISFRTSARDLLSEDDDIRIDDGFLLRWLIARDFNPDKAYTMLKNYLEWKDKNEIDKILDWSPPEELRDACPFQVIPEDNTGRPILIFPWGRWKPWVFTEKYLSVYQKYMDYMINTVIHMMNPPATQFVIIGDSEGFTYGHMKYIKALEVNLEAVKQFEIHYPELMHSAIVINCPKAFTLLYSLVKPLMSHRTRSKITMFGCDQDKWKQFISERVSQDLLPRHYRIDGEESSSPCFKNVD